jgi:integrase
MIERLTDLKVRQTKPTAKTQKIADGGGLFLFIEPTGSKLWRFRYRWQGKDQMLSLGKYPEVSLLEARHARDAIKLDELKHGINPADKRKAEKLGVVTNSFKQVATEWYDNKDKSDTTWSTKQSRKVMRRMEMYIFPVLGELEISTITTPQVQTLIERIPEDGKKIEIAHRVKSLIGTVMRYGIRKGYCLNDPTAILSANRTQGEVLPTRKVKHMPAFTEQAQIKPFLLSLNNHADSEIVLLALKFSILVFQRPNEIRKSQWAEIDFEKNEWRYFITKTETPHIVPLSTQAIAILKRAQEISIACDYVFTLTGDKPLSDGTLGKALRKLGWKTDKQITPHGFRSMARTLIAECLGTPAEWIELQLGHKVSNPLGEAYDRAQFLKQRKTMMQDWSDWLDNEAGQPWGVVSD